METQRRYHSAFQRLNLKDDFEFDINDISRASTPTSTMSSKSEGHRRRSERSHHHRSHSIEDYKRKIARLKSELEAEKARTKQMHREKSSEIKMLRETYEKDKKKEIESIEVKLTEAKKKEIELLQETILKNKDKELQQVLRYKEGEVQRLREKFEQEKEKIKEAVLESEKRQFEENARKMEEQIHRLKEEKEKYEQDYKRKCEEEKKKEAEFSQIKEGYDIELRKILGEHRKLAMGNLEKLKLAEKQLNEGVISEDEAMSITESLRITPFSEISSRAPSRPLVTRMKEFRLEELEIEKYLASATPSPNPAAMLGRTFTIDGKSPLSVIVQPQDSTCNTPSIAGSEPSTTTKEATMVVRIDRIHTLLTNWVQRLQHGVYLTSRPLDERRVAAKTSLYKITRNAMMLHFRLLELEKKDPNKDRKSLKSLQAKGLINLDNIDLCTVLDDDLDEERLLSEEYELWRFQVLKQEAMDRIGEIPQKSGILDYFSCFKITTNWTKKKRNHISSHDGTVQTEIKDCKKNKQKQTSLSSVRRAISSIFHLK